MKPSVALSHRKILSAVLIVAGALVLWHSRVPLSGALAALSDWKAMAACIQGYGVLGPLMLFLLMLAQVFVAFIPGHALVIASGYIYGAPLTILVVATSTIAGSEIAFYLARKYGRPLIYRLASPAAIERWDRLAGNRGAGFYFLVFVLPFLPSDLMCYVAGLGKIPHRQFLAANVAGRLLFTIGMTAIGAFQLRPPLGFWLVFFAVLAVLYIAWWIQRGGRLYISTAASCRTPVSAAASCQTPEATTPPAAIA